MRRIGWAVAALAALACASAATAAVKSLTVISSRPDRVSGGDALVKIVETAGSASCVTLNGHDVTGEFRTAGPRSRIGLVGGLKLGRNALAADGVTLTLTDYPIAGPIFSGPHQTPFICTTDKFPIYAALGKPMVDDPQLFGPSLDADCSAKTKITYLYLPKGASELKPLADPSQLPADVASTTTLAGTTVPFVVRFETATIDRGIYQSAVLFDPTSDAPPSWKAPPKGWNRRLIAIQGAGCPGGWYFQGMVGGSSNSGSPTRVDASLLSIDRLGEGYALYGNTLQNASQNCNAVLEGEAAAMGKEHFIKTFGPPVWTVSVGCSGGSYGSAQPADALPGLYDGVLIACTFPDPLAIANAGSDAHLLQHYFDVTGKGALTDDEQIAISGYKGLKAFHDAANQAGRGDPVPGRVDAAGYKSAAWSDLVPVALRYDPKTNPKGARPTIYDNAKNIYGVDPATGFGLRTFDNVGVQYGLAALNAGQISPPQFLDLNARIGGYDADMNYTLARAVGSVPAIRRAHQSGLETSGGGGLAQIPVMDLSGIYNDDGGYHYQWYHFALRARMAKANGDTRNHVMWRGNPVPFDKAWSAFVAWVDAARSDTADGTARSRVLRDKPAAAVDGCWTSPTEFKAEPQTFSREPRTDCNRAFPSFGNARLMAGGPLAADVMKCALKPVSAADYQVAMSAAQLAQLRRIFRTGVCDWSRPGAGAAALAPWGSFGPAKENLVFERAP